MKNNRASNATYLGQFIAGVINPATEDQYQPMPAPLFVDGNGYTEKEQNCKGCMGPCGQCEEQEPDAEELPDQDWAAQKTEYEL